MSYGKGLHPLFDSYKIKRMSIDKNPGRKLPIDTWPVIICGTFLSALFFIFGVDQLIASYDSTDPYLFLMLFFSSSMIILVNGTIFLMLVVMGCRKLIHHNDRESEQNSSTADGNDIEPM